MFAKIQLLSQFRKLFSSKRALAVATAHQTHILLYIHDVFCDAKPVKIQRKYITLQSNWNVKKTKRPKN